MPHANGALLGAPRRRGGRGGPGCGRPRLRREHELLDAVCDLFLAVWRAGHALVAVAPGADLDQLAARLSPSIDLAAAEADARFIPVETNTALAAVSGGEVIDEARFTELFGPLIDRASLDRRGGQRHVTAFGCIAPVLVRAGRDPAAHDIEEIANRFLVGRPLSILCPCHVPHHGALSTPEVERRCATHAAVVPIRRRLWQRPCCSGRMH